MMEWLKKMQTQATQQSLATGKRIPVHIGGGGREIPLSDSDSPWVDPVTEIQTGVPQPHARRQPQPRSGGHPPDIRDADLANNGVDSVEWAFKQPLAVPPAEMGRRLDSEQYELRLQLLNVSFVPYPSLTKTYRATADNQVYMLEIPERAQLVRFSTGLSSSSTGKTWVARFPFTLPFTTAIGDGTNQQQYIDPMVNPDSYGWLYIAGLRSLWIGIETNTDVLSAAFYVTQ